MLTLSTSGQSDLRECPCKYHYSHPTPDKPWRYRPVITPFPLYFGNLMHKGLNAWHRTKGNLTAAFMWFQDEPNLLTKALAQAMLIGYHYRWIRDPVDVFAVERGYELPLIDGVNHNGRRDVDAEVNGDLVVIEHKTTTSSIDFDNSIYWRSKKLDQQINNYLASAEAAYGRRPIGVLYDVLHIPDAVPFKATPIGEQRLVKAGQRKGELLASQHLRDETPDEYRDRLIEVIAADPDKHYRRKLITRLRDEERVAADNLRGTAHQLKMHVEHNLWPQNPAACGRYKEPCQFLGVCEGRVSIDDTRVFTKEVKEER